MGKMWERVELTTVEMGRSTSSVFSTSVETVERKRVCKRWKRWLLVRWSFGTTSQIFRVVEMTIVSPNGL